MSKTNLKDPKDIPLFHLYVSVENKHAGMWLPIGELPTSEIEQVEKSVSVVWPTRFVVDGGKASFYVYFDFGKFIKANTWEFGAGILDDTPERIAVISELALVEVKGIAPYTIKEIQKKLTGKGE